jgi:hypothetical protein
MWVSGLFSRIRRPVKRERAERYLLLTLLSFAASVVLTRWYLELTGYPRIGGGTLHIAHVIWGGLLLFVASLLPVIMANRQVYSVSASLSGIGVGLFIDEVGKFITQSNDYFFPFAAPIIYAFFLLTVLLYLQVRRPPSRDSRAELYRALDGFAEVLDHDLDPAEQTALRVRLQSVAAQGDQPELARLAQALLRFLESDELHLIQPVPGRLERAYDRAREWERRWLPRQRLRTLVTVGLAVLGLPALLAIPASLFLSETPDATATAIASGPQVATAASPTWLWLRLAITGIAAIPLCLAAGFLAFGRERRGISLGYFSLLFSLTVVDLLLFYLDQFQAVVGALLQFGLLLAVIRFRRLGK